MASLLNFASKSTHSGTRCQYWGLSVADPHSLFPGEQGHGFRGLDMAGYSAPKARKLATARRRRAYGWTRIRAEGAKAGHGNFQGVFGHGNFQNHGNKDTGCPLHSGVSFAAAGRQQMVWEEFHKMEGETFLLQFLS